MAVEKSAEQKPLHDLYRWRNSLFAALCNGFAFVGDFSKIPLTKEGNYAIITKLRGVAQVVARQFRVLEAASSSPATSTKKAIGAHWRPYGFFALSGGEENLLPVL